MGLKTGDRCSGRYYPSHHSATAHIAAYRRPSPWWVGASGMQPNKSDATSVVGGRDFVSQRGGKSVGGNVGGIITILVVVILVIVLLRLLGIF